MPLNPSLTRALTRQLNPSLIRAEPAVAAVTDEFFEHVVLLHDFAGADAATDITDLSNRGHIETFVGDAQVDTALQILETNSVIFDGTTDNITVPDSADWDFDLGDFTIEFHVLFSASTTAMGLVSAYDAANGGFFVAFNGVGDLLNFGYGDIITIRSESWTPADDTWFHIAISRKADVVYMFVDGVEFGTGVADTTNFLGGTEPLHLGMLKLSTIQPLFGSIAAVRITKGTGRYDAAFTPPSVFYPLLGPANPADPDFASVVLLLDWAGTDGGQDTTDLSDSAHTDTWVGSGAVIDDDIQYLLQNSFLSDGVDTYVTFPDSTDWDFGTGDFTVEFGMRVSSFNNKIVIGNYDGVSEGWQLQLSSVGPSLKWYNFDVLITHNHSIATNAWTHIAIARSGTTLKMFIDGAEVASVTDSSDYSGSAKPLTVGASAADPTTQEIVGNIGQIRVTKGVARYTAAFTAPKFFFPTS